MLHTCERRWLCWDSACTRRRTLTHSCAEQAVTIIDTLRRAGASVTVASVEDSLTVTCSRSVKLTADKGIQDCAASEYDLICLPASASCRAASPSATA